VFNGIKLAILGQPLTPNDILHAATT